MGRTTDGHVASMRQVCVLGAVVVLMVGACGISRPSVPVCAPVPDPSSAATAAHPKEPVYGITRDIDGDGSAVLARRDALSFQPVSRSIAVPEYHDAWALSPDGKQIALGISAPSSEFGGRQGRVGVLLVDLTTMRVLRGIETGIAADALAWLTPTRLVAGLLREGTVLIDPRTGTIVTRWPEFSDPQASAQTDDALVMLAGPDPDTTADTATAPVRLAVVDASAGLRTVSLERIELRSQFADGTHYSDRAGLAVDPTHKRALVVAAGSPIAEVDLRTLRVTYHSNVLEDVQATNDVLAHTRNALWLRDERFLVFGRDVRPSGEFAAGASIIDTADWTSCSINAEAGKATISPDRLLLYADGAGPGVGLRGYTVTGRPAFQLFAGDHLSNVFVAAGRAYIQNMRRFRVVDASTGEILSDIPASFQIADLISASYRNRPT